MACCRSHPRAEEREEIKILFKELRLESGEDIGKKPKRGILSPVHPQHSKDERKIHSFI